MGCGYNKAALLGSTPLLCPFCVSNVDIVVSVYLLLTLCRLRPLLQTCVSAAHLLCNCASTSAAAPPLRWHSACSADATSTLDCCALLSRILLPYCCYCLTVGKGMSLLFSAVAHQQSLNLHLIQHKLGLKIITYYCIHIIY